MAASAEFPITEAQLTGLFVEAVVFGIHIVTFGFCLHALLTDNGRKKRWRDVRWVMVVVAVALFVIATFDLALGFYHNIKAFVFYTGQGGALSQFINISDWINVCKSVTVVVQSMIGDAMLIYRCWVVYGHSWLIIFLPGLLWLGCLAITIWIIILESTLHTKVLVNSKQLQPTGNSFWALTIAINIITTGLLVWRLWRVETNNRTHRLNNMNSGEPSPLRKVMRIVIESGLLYTVTAFISFVTFITGSNGVYVITDAQTHIVGISFNLITIRASRIINRGEGHPYSTSGTTSRNVPLQIVNTHSHISSSLAQQKTEVHVVMTHSSLHDDEKIVEE